MNAYVAQNLIEIIGWMTIGFCVGMALFERMTLPGGVISLRLGKAPPREKPAKTNRYKDAA